MTAGSRSAADIAEQPEVLSRAVDANAEALDRARAAVHGARVVRYLGIGSSKHAAGYGAVAMDVLGGIPASVLSAPGTSVPMPPFGADQPLVVVSQSGRTPALLDTARRAAESGVEVIAVTNEPGSPLEGFAAVTLHCAAGAERVVAATKSVTAQMLLLRALAASPSADAVTTLAWLVREVLQVETGVVVSGAPPSGVVCAGFAGDWVADEIAIKFAEMAGVPATSSSVVEHFHGPRATATPTLAFLDPGDPNSVELSRDDAVTSVGPHPDFDVRLPTTHDPSLDAITWLVCGQRLAHAWALQLGEDPDGGRGLSKVTGTR